MDAPRILIAYLNAGLGHRTHAQAVKKALSLVAPGADVRLMDLGAEISDAIVEDLFVRSWQRILALPAIVKSALFAMNAFFTPGFAVVKRRLKKRTLGQAMALLEASGPDAILCTHWACAHVLDPARRALGMKAPLYSLYGELAGAYHMIRSGADYFFCLTEEARDALVAVGVPRELIVLINLIVEPDLCGDFPEQRAARRALGLEEEKFTVLFSLGGEGIGRITPFLDLYYRTGAGAQILFLTGKNAGLLQSLRDRYPQRPGRARVAPVEYLPDLKIAIAAADVFAGKCGGSFASEAVKARKLLLVNNLGAPNEAHNRDYMVKHGFAFYTPRPPDFVRTIETLATDPGAFARAMEPLENARRGNGAEDIARFMLDGLGKTPRS
jgi:UDP-N-acetylglucosamine:LPS N-acetylglucosamine transferase